MLCHEVAHKDICLRRVEKCFQLKVRRGLQFSYCRSAAQPPSANILRLFRDAGRDRWPPTRAWPKAAQAVRCDGIWQTRYFNLNVTAASTARLGGPGPGSPNHHRHNDLNRK